MTGIHSISIPSSAVRGWAVSFLAHGLAIGLAITLFADLKLVPEKEPFRWQVSQVVTPPPEPTPEAQPSKPVAQPAPVRPSTPPPPPRQVAERPAPQTAVRSIQPMQAIERPVAEPVTREVKQVQAEKAVQANQPVPVATQAVSTAETQARPAEIMTKTGPVAAERATVTRESVAVATPAAPAAVEAVAATTAQHAQSQPTQAPIQEAMVRPRPVEPAARHEALEPGPAEPPPPKQSAPAEAVPVRATPATKADYGWLADTLRRRVAEVKRYPHEARLNHWHGKVVLHAVIKDDGHLADLRVHESSGHEVLDEAAMEAVRHACPLMLKHALGRAQVAIRIPINYTLND